MKQKKVYTLIVDCIAKGCYLDRKKALADKKIWEAKERKKHLNYEESYFKDLVWVDNGVVLRG